MFQQDYILRQIELMAKGIAKLAGIKTSLDVFDEIIRQDGTLSGEQYLRYTLDTLVADGKINEAEDLLYETVEAHPRPEYFGVALEFYGALARMDEEELKRHDFSRREVLDGLEGIGRMAEAQSIK